MEVMSPVLGCRGARWFPALTRCYAVCSGGLARERKEGKVAAESGGVAKSDGGGRALLARHCDGSKGLEESVTQARPLASGVKTKKGSSVFLRRPSRCTKLLEQLYCVFFSLLCLDRRCCRLVLQSQRLPRLDELLTLVRAGTEVPLCLGKPSEGDLPGCCRVNGGLDDDRGRGEIADGEVDGVESIEGVVEVLSVSLFSSVRLQAGIRK
jgi:hypothetical protein